jgi:hypothetical protein
MATVTRSEPLNMRVTIISARGSMMKTLKMLKNQCFARNISIFPYTSVPTSRICESASQPDHFPQGT